MALVVLAGTLTANGWAPENRALVAKATRLDYAWGRVGFWPFVLVMVVVLLLDVLGLVPDLEPALYLTAVVAGPLAAASMLFMLVFLQRPPAATVDQAELPSTGGSSDWPVEAVPHGAGALCPTIACRDLRLLRPVLPPWPHTRQSGRS